jgi:hypothetical protein
MDWPMEQRQHSRRLGRYAVATGLLAIAAVASTLTTARAEMPANACEEAVQLAVLASPVAPWKGAPLRVVFAVEKPLDGEFTLIAPDGSVAAKSTQRGGGPPYFWYAEVATPVAGAWRATLTSSQAPAGCNTITHDIAVRADAPAKPGTVAGSVWPIRNTWSRATENLFSAWIEKLFDDPIDATPSWPALHEVLRDRSRNILFNHLGLREDEMKVVLRPDCADLPYFLRAYFAFKMGLPFGYSKCSRGGHNKAPQCFGWFSIVHQEPPRVVAPPGPATNGLATTSSSPPPPAAPPKRLGLVGAFGEYMRTVADAVHSGTGRTALADNNTDYYPVLLSQETLRPGTIYADPYGHILMLTKRVAQTKDNAGLFFAVDGQPDGTVARKRFWQGNFLFAQDPRLGGPGFKRFRPIMRGTDGVLRRLTNDQIARNPQYADFSLDQSSMSMEAFYDRMDEVMSPSPLVPLRALKEAIDSLEEQVKVRVTSVENGRKFQSGKRGEATMPDGPAIFETTGAWEDFSTPSRDLRLLIAIDVVLGFPDRVARRPDRFAMPAGQSAADVKSELQRVLVSELPERKFSYTRSDGSQWTLTLKEVLDRMVDLEMAYNPNDCVELRWGARPGSDEASTCKRHAPAAQKAKMSKYREWFHERRRPPRA